LILASLLPVLVTRAFIYYASSGSSCFLLGLWMLFYAVKLYKVRTQKLLGL
jgi:protoheme IX farnesyltransferase